MRLTEVEKIEIKELFDGSYASTRELAEIFGVARETIAYIVNYGGYKERHNKYTANWRKNNSEKYKKIIKKSSAKYYKKKSLSL